MKTFKAGNIIKLNKKAQTSYRLITNSGIEVTPDGKELHIAQAIHRDCYGKEMSFGGRIIVIPATAIKIK